MVIETTACGYTQMEIVEPEPDDEGKEGECS